MKRKKIILFFYNRLFDPLIQGNLWLYITHYLNDPMRDIDFHVITYEDSSLSLSTEQITLVREWREKGLDWSQLRWHSGSTILSKLIDIFAGFHCVIKLRFRGYLGIISLGSIAGSFAYLYARVLGLKLFLYQFEPHSEYAIDTGLWNKDDLVVIVTKKLERLSAEFATCISSGTVFMKERLELDWQVSGLFFKIPSVVNEEKFHFNPDDRRSIREDLKILDNKILLFYPGKFGGIYYSDEIALIYKSLLRLDENIHFLIVTPNPINEIHDIFDRNKIQRSYYTVRSVDYSEIHSFYSAADFGLVAVPPGPSKKFISNIKVGEYLCSGLPFLIVEGVSEDFLLAKTERVGVVVKEFSADEIISAWPKIKSYSKMNQKKLREHCRAVGLAHRSLSRLNPVFKEAVDYLRLTLR